MEPSAMNALLQGQKAFFRSGKTRSISFRIASLKKLKAVISDHEKEILAAVYDDLHKEATDAFATEISGVYTEIKLAIGNVSDWAARQKVPTPFFMRPSKSYIYKEPYGVALIIAPWNYPFQLLILPLVGAIAAGNTAILKPSEISSHTAAILEKIIRAAFPPEYICVVQGERPKRRRFWNCPSIISFSRAAFPSGRRSWRRRPET